MRGLLDRLPAAVDILGHSPRQAGDDRPAYRAGDPPDRREVVRRGSRETGLDHVSPQLRELLGHLDLLIGGQREARRLLAIAQRGVENNDSIHRYLLSLFM